MSLEKYKKKSELNVGTAQDNVPRISIKAKIFRLEKEGEEIHKQSDPIIVQVIHAHSAKTYYSGPYNPESNDAPDCRSNDAVFPDPDVQNPQAARCDMCEKNMWGSKITASGKRAKACTDIIYVQCRVIDPDVDTDEIYTLRIPPMSMKAFKKYVDELEYDVCLYKTKISFLPTDFPQLGFESLGTFTEDEFFDPEEIRNRIEEDKKNRMAAIEAKPAQPTPTPAPLPPADDQTEVPVEDPSLSAWG